MTTVVRRTVRGFLTTAVVVATGSMSVPLLSQGSGAVKQVLQSDTTPGLFLGLASEGAPAPFHLPDSATSQPLPSDEWEIDPSTGAEYKRGELLVKFAEGASASARASAVSRAATKEMPRMLPQDWQLVSVQDGKPVSDTLRVLQEQDGVESASLNYRVSAAQARVNDEFYGIQWNFDAIGVPAAWEINPGGGSDVVVAVVDTGLNTSAQTLVFSGGFAGQVPVTFAPNPDLATGSVERPFDFVYRDQNPVDLDGHGTHVAGTIAQTTNNNIGLAGVAYRVKLMPLKVLASSDSWDRVLAGVTSGGSVATIAEAITYAANNGARVINLSLAGTGTMPAVRDAIRQAVSRGAFVAIAAGNAGDDGNPIEYPAAYGAEIDGAMTVGAVDRSLRRTAYSSFHPYVEICAPGGVSRTDADFDTGVTQVTYRDVETGVNSSAAAKLQGIRVGFRPRFDRFFARSMQGTSMAAPHVSAVAALLYSQGIRNPAAIEAAIETFARPINANANECGAGLLDARRALRGLGIGR
jgi:serine protease